MPRTLALIVASSLVAAACASGADSAPASDGLGGPQQIDTQAPNQTSAVPGPEFVKVDPLFDRATIVVGGESLNVAIADTAGKRSQGLMFVTDLGDIDGMLFVFQGGEVRSFWMSNTPLALDIVFFDNFGNPVGEHLMLPCSDTADDCPSYLSDGSATYALETAAGVFDFGASVLDVATVP